MDDKRDIEWTYTFCEMICNMAQLIQDVKTRQELPDEVADACESAADSLEILYRALDGYRSKYEPRRRLKKAAARIPKTNDECVK